VIGTPTGDQAVPRHHQEVCAEPGRLPSSPLNSEIAQACASGDLHPRQAGRQQLFFTYQIENGAFTEPDGLHPIYVPTSVVASVTGNTAG
jgi:hypothetical protein